MTSTCPRSMRATLPAATSKPTPSMRWWCESGWNGRDYGPGGQTVFLIKAPVDKPWQPFETMTTGV